MRVTVTLVVARGLEQTQYVQMVVVILTIVQQTSTVMEVLELLTSWLLLSLGVLARVVLQI
jgi:hypothetical protein